MANPVLFLGLFLWLSDHLDDQGVFPAFVLRPLEMHQFKELSVLHGLAVRIYKVSRLLVLGDLQPPIVCYHDQFVLSETVVLASDFEEAGGRPSRKLVPFDEREAILFPNTQL